MGRTPIQDARHPLDRPGIDLTPKTNIVGWLILSGVAILLIAKLIAN